MSRLGPTLAAGAVIAVAAYWLGARERAAPAPAQVMVAPPAATPRLIVTAPPASPSASGLSVDDVRAVIREELAARDDGAAAPAVPEAATVEQRVTTARAAIDDGLGDGVWDDRDRVALHAALAQLGPDDTARAIAPLFLAINAQRVELHGPPL